MVIQAVMGLVLQTAYRDIDWIRATWFGNDWVTLVVAVPLLFAGLVRGAVRLDTKIATIRELSSLRRRDSRRETLRFTMT